MKRLTKVLALVLTLSMVAAACGSDGETTAADDAPATTAAPAAATTAAPAAAARVRRRAVHQKNPCPRKGRILRITRVCACDLCAYGDR